MTRSLPARLIVTAAATAALLAGCHRQPAGQVVAVVDGHEITRRDLLTELRAIGGRSEADLSAAQRNLASALVDRKLLVDEAKREKLDKNPEFLSLEQRQHDILLASMLMQTLIRQPKSDPAAVQQFIAANPQMFNGRKLLRVSEIMVASKDIKAQDIKPLHGEQAVAAYLNAKKIKFAQRSAVLDSMKMPKQLFGQLLALPAGEPLAIDNGNATVFTTVIDSRDAPVPQPEQAKLAEGAMLEQNKQKQLEDQLNQLRGQAEIKYLPGFEPNKTPGAKGGA